MVLAKYIFVHMQTFVQISNSIYLPTFSYTIFFEIIEVVAFLLPAFPSSLRVRLLILCIYWLGHHYKLQYEYVKIKKTFATIREE